ncbi:D-alanyl-D-alanine carboxypeptidase family protein [Magnetovibrio blakemorei]|uniref:serine-type D-Ala-D-Ala carboxypeptidase n=1 Tax=Magnetovibrio blakemorei TaxID=28181 RepID=A0A1E5Q4A3_9PROT|nr:D-alanyl-D-alanine carboxypeptidase family protein [Magnetovibrio blakemorei]OEJ64670.1 D-alanyl-D-alanine carboxypeptidase [Magnetovibrio blakemorei]
MLISRHKHISVLAAAAFTFVCAASSVHALETPASHVYLVDTETNTVLLDKNGDELMAPASMSKLMTLYMVFERLKDGRLSLDDKFYVSENAWRNGGESTGGSTMFLEPAMRVRVEDLIRGIIVQSGNDACIVIAEALSGSEEAFAEEMNAKARELGMTNSTFKNSTGWPNPDHRLSAHDLAHLAKLTVEHFPEFYHYYSEHSFFFNGIKQSNRNPLIYKDMGADGLKTGHTEESGYGLTASAKRKDRRLVLVVNGLASKKMRSTESERLLEWGFREFDNYALFKAGDVVTDAKVWLGEKPSVALVIENDLTLTLPKRVRPDMKVTATFQEPLPAPILKGQRLGTLSITAPDVAPVEIPLLAAESVEQLGLVGRLGAALDYILWGGSY